MRAPVGSQTRPVIHHLNADSSWLVQLPKCPDQLADGVRLGNTRAYYNILIDPWLQGSQTDMFAWFSRQWHAEPSRLKDIVEVCQLAWQAEREGAAMTSDISQNCLDLVIISHEFTDHCHKDTLVEVDCDVPVLAPRKAANLIRSWKYFENVVDMKSFSSQPDLEVGLPSWLNVSRLQRPGDFPYLHAAVIIAFQTPDSDVDECIVYTPHGITPDSAAMLMKGRPTLQPLCLIHGLHDVWLTMTQQINLGGYNGLQVYRQLGCKYWVSTHDEDKKGEGFVSYVLNRKPISVADAINTESSGLQSSTKGAFTEVNFTNVSNGSKLVLV